MVHKSTRVSHRTDLPVAASTYHSHSYIVFQHSVVETIDHSLFSIEIETARKFARKLQQKENITITKQNKKSLKSNLF